MKGHIRPRGKGTWAIVVDLGRDPNGKRQQKWHTVHGNKKDAERELTRLLHQLHNGDYVEPSKMTLGEYMQRWLDDYAATNVSAKTFERYAEIVRIHLIPALGRHQLPKLQPLHIQAYYSQALQNGRKNGGGGLSAQTVLHHHRILREALNHAVRWQMLARNPADSVEPPRSARQEMQVIDGAEIDRLLRASEGSRLHLPILLAIATGMRRGEILALRWQDMDLDAGTLAVVRSLEETRTGFNFKEPKTAKGRRVIALPSMAVSALRRHKAEQAQHRLLLGEGYKDQGLVCAEPTGEPILPSAISNGFPKLLSKVELPPIRFHDLRHSHATMLLREGIHPKIVSERLGHATIGITLDVYSHVLPSMQEEAARKLDVALRAAGENRRSAI